MPSNKETKPIRGPTARLLSATSVIVINFLNSSGIFV